MKPTGEEITIKNTRLFVNGIPTGQYVCQGCGDTVSTLTNIAEDFHVCSECAEEWDDDVYYIVYLEDENGEREGSMGFTEIEDSYAHFRETIITHATNSDEYSEEDFSEAFDNGCEIIGKNKLKVEYV